MMKNQGIVQNLNFEWEFYPFFQEEMLGVDYIGKEIKKVNIPHNAVDIPYNNFDEKMTQIECLYRKKIYISEEFKEKETIIYFEGIMTYAKVYVNGIFAGEHKGGYNPFNLNISQLVVYGGENLISVYVDTHERKEIPPFGFVIDYLTYGGIYREVRIEHKNNIWIDNFHVKTKNVLEEKKMMEIDIYLENPKLISGNFNLLFEIKFKRETYKIFSKDIEINGEDKVLLSISEEISGVKLWDINNPNLYTISIKIEKEDILDEKEVSFGFREANFKNDGFYLNGEKIKIRGLNRHQSFPYVGYAMPKNAQRKDAELLKYDLGVNLVRLSHYPQSNHFMDRCDEIGLLVFDEIPGWQHIGTSEEWISLAKENVKDMIKKDWNHPSVIIWGVRINESKDDNNLYKETNKIAHLLDDTRATGGVRYLEGSELLEDVYTFNDFSHTGKNKGLKKRNIVTKKEVPYLVTEHNGHMFPTKKFDYEPHRIEQAKRHLKVLESAYGSNDIAGAIGWCMFDYNTHKDFGSGDKICYHGVMDMFRIEKYAAFLYLSMQDEIPVLKVANSMEIGDFPGSMLGDTYIFTNCDMVKVYKNDEYIDTFYPSREIYKNVPHPPVIVDNYIGNRIHQGEKFTKRDADFIKKSFIKQSRGEGNDISILDKLRMGYILIKYKLKFSDAYQLYAKYMGTWGSSSTTYKYEGYRDGKCIITEEKSQLGTIQMKVIPDNNKLIEEDTYDVTRIVVKLEDDKCKPLTYSSEFVSISLEGYIELIGPKDIPLIGGSSAFWIKSIGKKGVGKVFVESKEYGKKELLINIE